jgi:hypothetical protein
MFKRFFLLLPLPLLFLVAACNESYLNGEADSRPLCEYAPAGVNANIGKYKYNDGSPRVTITYTDQGVERSKYVYLSHVSGVKSDDLKDDASIAFAGCLAQAANLPNDLVPVGQTAFIDKVYVWVEVNNGFSERFVEVRMTYGATSLRWITVNPPNWDDWKTGNVLKSGQQLKGPERLTPNL